MDGMLTKEEIEELLRQVEEDMPRLNAIKKKQLEYFYSLRPDRCGKIDFENNEVQYDDEHYTEWYSNHGIESIEDWLRIYDLVGLDYELRIADIYDPSDTFSIKFANTEEDHRKYWIASELHTLYYNYYIELLKENGIDVYKIDGFRYWIPWSGCEKEIEPEKYSDDNLLISAEQIVGILSELYPKAYKKATAPKPIAELKFEKVMTETGEKRICKARLDEEHLLQYREEGEHILQININADKFWGPNREEIEDGRKIYYLEFFMD